MSDCQSGILYMYIVLLCIIIVIARPVLDRLCVYLPNCVLYVSDVHARIGAWCGQCPSPLTCMNRHGSMVHANVNKV